MAETAPHHRFAVMTASLVAANVLLFLLTLFLSHALRPDNEVLALGWKNNASVVAGQIWRLVTCCLLHAGWTHLILNMALLWYVGSVLEDTLGPWPPLVIYWVSGVAGAALSCRLGHYTSVGASGAVLGLVGAGIVLSRGQALPAEDRAELGRPMIFWLAATLVVGWLQPHIDQWAHLGGTACGAFLALSVRPGPAGPWRRGLERALAAGVMLAVLVSTGVMIRATRSDDVERRQVFALGVSLETPAQWLTRRSLPDLVEFGAPGVSARIRLRRTWLDRQLPVAQEPRLLQAAVGRMHLVAGPTRIDLPDGRHVWWVRVWPQEVVDCYAWFRDDQVVEVIGLAPPDRIRHYESLFRRAAESVRPL